MPVLSSLRTTTLRRASAGFPRSHNLVTQRLFLQFALPPFEFCTITHGLQRSTWSITGDNNESDPAYLIFVLFIPLALSFLCISLTTYPQFRGLFLVTIFAVYIHLIIVPASRWPGSARWLITQRSTAHATPASAPAAPSSIWFWPPTSWRRGASARAPAGAHPASSSRR